MLKHFQTIQRIQRIKENYNYDFLKKIININQPSLTDQNESMTKQNYVTKAKKARSPNNNNNMSLH